MSTRRAPRLAFRFSNADVAEGLADWFDQEVRRAGDVATVVRAALRAYRQRGGAAAGGGDGDAAAGPGHGPGLAAEDKSEIARLVVVALRNAGLVVAPGPGAPDAPAPDRAGAREAARSMLGHWPPPDDE